MRYLIGFISTIFILSLFNSLSAQVDTVAISKIKGHTKYIDSLLKNDERQKFVVQSIEEGKITQEIVSATIGHYNKIDSTRKIKNGGFEKYTTQNIKGDTVYKISYSDNIDKNLYEIHYYKDNKLVYSKIDYQENGIGETFYFREEYYKNGKTIFVSESSKPIDEVYRQRITFDLKEKGIDYLKEFQSDRK